MKYMTKKWYNTMQKTDLHFFLKVSKKAETFSEEYFKELYKKFNTDRKNTVCYKNNLKKLKKKLPKYILDEVSDIRVLALGYASKNVYNKIEKYCEANERYVKKMMNDYDKYYEKEFKKKKPIFLDDFYFHDCVIVASRYVNNDIIFYINNKYEFAKKNKIIFKNGKIIKQESEFKNLMWLYEEIYRVNGKYEIHVLLANETGKLRNIIIECADVQYDCIDALLESDIVFEKCCSSDDIDETFENYLNIMNRKISAVQINCFNNFGSTKIKFLMKDEIKTINKKIYNFLKNNKEEVININKNKKIVEMKLKPVDKSEEVIIGIKVDVANNLFNAELNIKTETWLLKSFADKLSKLNNYEIGYKIYLNGFNID